MISKEQDEVARLNKQLTDAENKLKRVGSSTANSTPATVEELNQKLMDVESSNKVLRRIKNAYK